MSSPVSQDLLLLRGLMVQANWVRYAPTIDKLEDLDKPVRVLFRLIGDYFTTYAEEDSNIKAIHPTDLQAHFTRRYPKQDGMDLVVVALNRLSELDVTEPEILRAAINRFVEKHFLNKLLLSAVPVLEDDKETAIDTVTGLLEEYQQVAEGLDEEDGENFSPIQIEELLEYTEAEGLLWPVSFLNEALGPVRAGFLYHFFARPDSGKTSVACHTAAYFAYQLAKTTDCILYMNNEEHINRVNKRLVCALLGTTVEGLAQDPAAHQRAFNVKGGSRIVTKGDVQTVTEVERWISTYRPKVVIIDVGPKVQPITTSKDTNSVEQKHLAYKRFRELANRYDCAIITTGQADGTAEGKKYLKMGQMDGSKVGIPSELDAAIGIGIGDADGVRYFSVCKNKILGTYDKSFPYVLNPQTSRFRPQQSEGE